MSCNNNSNRGLRAAAACGVSSAAGKAAFAAGRLADGAKAASKNIIVSSGTYAGGVAGKLAGGIVGRGVASGVGGTPAGPVGMTAGSSIGATAGKMMGKKVGEAAASAQPANEAGRLGGMVGGVLGGPVGYLAGSALGNRAGQRLGPIDKTRGRVMLAGAAVGALGGGSWGAAMGPVGAVVGGLGGAAVTAWGADMDLKMIRWSKSEEGQQAKATFKSRRNEIWANRQPGLRGSLTAYKQMMKAKDDYLETAEERAWGIERSDE